MEQNIPTAKIIIKLLVSIETKIYYSNDGFRKSMNETFKNINTFLMTIIYRNFFWWKFTIIVIFKTLNFR